MSDNWDDEAQIQKAIKFYNIAPILKRFGDWVVTTYGIQCLKSNYPIEFSRVDEDDWIPHMREKPWVTIRDFAGALIYAKDLYTIRQSLELGEHPLNIFLCHGIEDKPAVRDLQNRLLAIGTDPWLDETKLLPGQNWKNEIHRALRKSDIVLACLSHETVSKTGFVQRELKDAIDAATERPEDQIFIIPVRLNECTLPDSLRKWQWVDLFLEDGFNRLVQALKLFSESKTKP